MALSLRYGFRQTQRLSLSQSQIQGIELLQLSTLELYERISQELLDNPVMEEEQVDVPITEAVADEKTLEMTLDGGDPSREEDEAFSESESLDGGDREHSDTERNRQFLESIVAEKETLKDHLLWQARLSALDKKELALFETIITSLDERGFITKGIPEYALEHKTEEEIVRRALSCLQQFDPVGCAVSGVPESLLVQARHYFPDDTLLHRILCDHFHDLEKLNHEKIAQRLHVPIRHIFERASIIQGFDPFPGRCYSSGSVSYARPDIDVKIVDDEIVITLLDEWIPRLFINPYYLTFLKKKDIEKKLKGYIQGKIQSAKHLMHNISSRRETIYRVVSAIMVHQKEFLRKGPGSLKPLTHIDIAHEVGMHESTVSRVTSNKYVQTGWGLYDLKYFFVSRLKSTGEDVSADKVMRRIAEIIGKEDIKRPYSDEEILLLLEKEGIRVARRTIAKYRDMLEIPSSNKRKKIHRLKTEGSI